MAMDFDNEEIPENMDGYDHPVPGLYHGQVSFVDEDDPKTGKMIVDVEVLAGKPDKQEGKSQRLFFNKTGKDRDASLVCKKMMLQFACATGLTTPEEIKANRESGKRMSIDFKLAIGRQLCFQVEPSTMTKSGTSVGWGIWHVDDPRAAAVPKNKGMLGKAGDAAVDPFGEGDLFD